MALICLSIREGNAVDWITDGARWRAWVADRGASAGVVADLLGVHFRATSGRRREGAGSEPAQFPRFTSGGSRPLPLHEADAT